MDSGPRYSAIHLTYPETRYAVCDDAYVAFQCSARARSTCCSSRTGCVSDAVPLNALPTAERWMDDAVAALDAAGVARAAVIGDTEGGPMATLLAATLPERVSALVLINTFARFARFARADLPDRHAARIPGATLVELPGADSFPMQAGNVDSTGIAAERGDAQWLALLNQHDEIVRDHLRRYRGVGVRHTGDGFIARFDGPARAVTCAARLVDALRAAGLEIRAGLHVGEIELVGDQIAGLAAHIAARVVAEAGRGEILTSGTVRDLVVGSGIAFQPRGERRLKGVPGTWPLFAATFVP